MGKRVFLRTFGCQMNERDSEIISGMLIDGGYEIEDDPEKADIVLFNTCSVRQHAEDRVMGNLRSLSSRKKSEPSFRIGVLGCMAKRHGEMLFKEFPQVDMVVGPSNIYDIPELMRALERETKILAVDGNERPGKMMDPAFRKGIFSAYVNIMYGCDNYCSYCVVPYVRGKEVSRPVEDVADEVRALADRGFKEITLLGQNVNSYGRGLEGRIRFPKLLKELDKIDGIRRIRFTSSHPKDANKTLFKAMRDLEKVCEHIHLPLQAGSDKMLDLMNRKYTVEEYMDKVDMLRGLVLDVGISTDILVGFPSEKDADFEATYEAMSKIRYNSAFVFKYSPRPPALSACLVDDVPEDVKKERNNRLLELQKEISSDINKDFVGTIHEVLVDGVSRMSDKELIGRTRNNTPCVFPGDKSMIGSIVEVEVKSSSPFTLKGELTGGYRDLFSPDEDQGNGDGGAGC